jgi:uncharacterized protein (TIRG00374 family)
MTGRIFTAILLTLCGGLIFYHVAKKITLQEMLNALIILDYKWIIGALAIAICTTIVRGYKWYLLTRQHHGLKVVSFVNVYIVNSLANQVLPMKLGELLTPYIIKKLENSGDSYFSWLTRLLLDRGIEAIFLVLLFIFSIAILLSSNNRMYFILIILLIIVAIMTNKLSIKKIIQFAPEFVSRTINKIKLKISIPEAVIIKKICLFTAVAYIGDIIGLFFILKATAIEVSLLNTIIIFSVSITLGSLSMIPSGIGIVEIITVNLLNQFGYDNNLSILTSLYMRAVSVLFMSIFCCYIVLLFGYVKIVKRQIHEEI